MSHTPLSLYQSRLDAGELKADKLQAQTVQKLDKLYHVLAEQQDTERGFLSRMMGHKADPATGVYLYGGVGRGKSMVMDLFYDALPFTEKQRTHFHSFMIAVHDRLHDYRQSEKADMDQVLPRLAGELSQGVRVLCFDEFHVVDVADAMILGRLFQALFENGVTVVATSNWAPDDLYKNGLQRDRFLPFIDLLKDHMDAFHLDADQDYRLARLQGKQVYFWPLGTPARKDADALFSILTDGADPVAEELTVKGRVLDVPASAKSVARFSFAELCERPLGAEDYLAIAQHYKTVFLEGVPKLGYDRRNEAKRLMILIDALYENNVQLVVTADTPPDELYHGKDHGFEFQRTISRLMEMQSADYMKA